MLPRIVLFIAATVALMPVSAAFGVPFALPVLVLALTAAFYRFDRKPMAELGLTPSWRTLAAALTGLAIGGAMFAVRALTLRALFGREFNVTINAATMAFLLSSVLVEELLFRGYAQMRLIEWRGTWTAVAVFAVLFGVYHWIQWNMWSNPAQMLTALLTTGAAHVLFTLALLRSGTLWMPVGLHFAWNAGHAAVSVTSPGTAGFAVNLALIAIVVAAMLSIAPRPRPLPAASP